MFLNLMLCLSSMAFAMGRGLDLPRSLARGNRFSGPYAAVLFVGTVVAALVAVGNILGLLSLSALTVLVYYGLANLSALRLKAADRFLPAVVPGAGLVFSFALAASVPVELLLPGAAVLAAGLVWRLVSRTLLGRKPEPVR